MRNKIKALEEIYQIIPFISHMRSGRPVRCYKVYFGCKYCYNPDGWNGESLGVDTYTEVYCVICKNITSFLHNISCNNRWQLVKYLLANEPSEDISKNYELLAHILPSFIGDDIQMYGSDVQMYRQRQEWVNSLWTGVSKYFPGTPWELWV